VLCGGRPLQVSPKAFDLLGLLLESRPRILGKDELRDRLWPGTFVGDTSLAKLVTELRKATRDARRAPRFIRTVHRFGYAFCGEAVEDGSRERILMNSLHGVVWQAHEIGLVEGDNIIGRGRDCQVRIDQPEISRHHARIRIAGEVASIEDLGSKNGTCVGGKRVLEPTNLQDGAEIVVGSEALLYRVSGAGRSTETGRRHT
jgi:DNA-binding winged helix-turn-helix (wHTH) protein